jgi:hypothetical protein
MKSTAVWLVSAMAAMLPLTAQSNRGLLASPPFQGLPIKAVYFFPGEARDVSVYTTHPTIASDLHWNSDPASRASVMRRMVAAHVNTVVLSYWHDMLQRSPMVIDRSAPSQVLDAARGLPLVIMPAFEVGHDNSDLPQSPQWEVANELPLVPNLPIAPGLMARIAEMVRIFSGHLDQWAQIYDRDGTPRYAINLLHVFSSQSGVTDDKFAAAFNGVAQAVELDPQISPPIKVGFTLDAVGGRSSIDDTPVRYSPTPHGAGPPMERTAAVLGIQGFVAEIFGGRLDGSPPWPNNNNLRNLPSLADWKRQAVNDWVSTGVPVILDVTNGYDGHLVFAGRPNSIFGDNMQATDDRWRNSVSELKGSGIKGIVFDTWNGYTEGFAAVPSREHQTTVIRWLTDLLEPDPRDCSHMQYAAGMPTFRVFGAICDAWIKVGADRGFGAPVSNEQPTQGGRGRVSYFADGKAIYWSGPTGAHEVHGIIEQTYRGAGEDRSCLRLPISNEEGGVSARVSRFEGGRIEWKPGDPTGRIICP